MKNRIKDFLKRKPTLAERLAELGWEEDLERSGKFVNSKIGQTLDHIPGDDFHSVNFGSRCNTQFLSREYDGALEAFTDGKGFRIGQGRDGSYLFVAFVEDEEETIRTIREMTNGYREIATGIYQEAVRDNPRVQEVYGSPFRQDPM